MLSTTSGMFSFCQTGPADLGGSAWDTTAEGTQNYSEFPDGDYYPGDAEEFYPYAHYTPKPDHHEVIDDIHATWMPATAADKAPKAEPMRRMTSRTSSNGSHKHRTKTSSSSSSKKSRSRVQSILSQTSSQMSKLDMTGNAAFQDGPVMSGRVMDVQQYLAQDLDTLSVSPHMNGSAYYMGFPDGLHYQNDVGSSMAVNPQIFDTGLMGTPGSWSSPSPVDSRMSSPDVPDAVSDNVWSAVPSASSPGESQHSNSPHISGQSPRYVATDASLLFLAPSHSFRYFRNRKDGSHYVTSEDLHGNHMPAMGQDAFSLPPAFSSRRMSGEGESARDHFLYKNAYPQADGLFHCPWEGEATCNHKPEKLKCNYE